MHLFSQPEDPDMCNNVCTAYVVALHAKLASMQALHGGAGAFR